MFVILMQCPPISGIVFVDLLAAYLMFVVFSSQLEAQAEERTAEAQKERKLRERTEQYHRQLEEELEGMKVTMHEYINIHLFPDNWPFKKLYVYIYYILYIYTKVTKVI